MPYVPALVGLVTDRGLAYCEPCARRLELAGEPIVADNSAYFAEYEDTACESCGGPITSRERASSRHFVAVAPGYRRPARIDFSAVDL